MALQSALKIVYLMPAVAMAFFDRSVGLIRRASAPVRSRFSHPVTQKRITVFIVCLALLLDNMLYMVIVPIIDNYFEDPDNATTLYIEPDHTFNPWNRTDGDPIAVSGYENASAVKEQLIDRLKDKLEMIKPVKISDYKDGMMGVLFASKAIVQLCVNPFTGAFIDRIGYITPLTLGLMVMFLSTVVFAGAETYAWLFIARSLQGLGSALANASSFGLIADRFQIESERSKILGIALAFISFGSLVAPPFGGVLFEFVGRPVPFVILAILCFIDASLLLLIEKPTTEDNAETPQPVGTPIHKLLLDPYILVIAGALMVGNFPLAFLEPTIAEWMKDTMNALPWEIGLIWLPPFFPHVLGVYMTVRLSVKYFHLQWLYGAVGLLLIGISTATVPACKSSGPLIFPLSVMCFGIALIDTALLPTLAFIVDTRHTSVYGSVYAIADISYSVAYAFGPVLAGQAVQHMGYYEMNLIIGLVNILFTPLLLSLRHAYDRGADKSQLHSLFTNTITMSDLESQQSNGHYAETRPETAVQETGKINGSGEKRALQITNRNYRATEESVKNEVVSTTVTPRPRPRAHHILADSTDDVRSTSNEKSGDLLELY